MPIQYQCAGCGNTVQTPDDSAGKKGRCPHCAHITVIPPNGAATAHVAPAGSTFTDSPPQYASPRDGQPRYGSGQPNYVAGQPPYAQGPVSYAPQPGYATGGYGYDGEVWSERSKIAAGLLGIFVGGWGVHRFYLGFIGIGILQIFVTIATCGIGGLWGFIEGILYLTGSMDRDVDGRRLRD